MNYFKPKKFPVALCLAAIVLVAGCHKKAVAPPPTPPPPPPAAPTAMLRATPDVIERGASSSLVWSTSNATSATISGLGAVALNDSRSVTPTESTTYTLTAQGPGGTVEASARVTVTQPPPPPPPPTPPPAMTEEEMFSANVKDIYFDYDKYKLRTEDSAVVDQDAAFLKQHAGMKVVIVGHCDDRGSAEYNIALGQNRAETMRNALLSDGVSTSQIRVISVGKEQPFCTEENEACWQQNRRAHVMLDR